MSCSAAWSRATGSGLHRARGGRVLGLCCHLLGDDFGLLSRQRDGYHGTPSPAGPGEAEFVGWLDDLQAQRVRAARGISPRLVTELLDWTGPQVAEMLRRQDPRARTAQVSWAGTGPVPVWLDQARELSEQWIHRQQLLQALDRPSDLRPRPGRAGLEGLRWAYPYRLEQCSAVPGDTVTIAISGPVTPDLAACRHPGRMGVPLRARRTGGGWAEPDDRAGVAAADQ